MRYVSIFRRHWSWDVGMHYSLLFLFLLLVYGPLLLLFGEASRYSLMEPEKAFGLVLPYGRRWSLIINSFMLAAAVTAGGTVLGILAGSVLWRWQTKIGRNLRWFLLVLAPIPPYLHALAWSSTIDGLILPLQQLGGPVISLQGWVGAWWVQLMALLPLSVGLTLIGLEAIDPALIEAAHLLRSDMQVFMRVALPLAAPPIAAGAGLLFLLSITDYSVPSLFSANVYSLEIFSEFSASNQPARAILLAFPLLILTMVVVAASQAALRNAAQSSPRQARSGACLVWPSWFLWLQRLSLAVLFFQVAVLLISSAATTGSLEKMISAVVLADREIAFTFWIALATGFATLPVALAASIELRQSGVRGRIFWALVTAPLAIPAPLVGIGLISIWSRIIWPGVYGSSAMPVLAALARFTPFAAIILLVQIRRIDPILIDAARIFQVKLILTWVRIWLPLLAPGLLAAAGIVFALSCGELGATLIVAPPGQATLTMRIYNYLHYGASGDVAGLCLAMAIITMMVGCLAALILVMSGKKSLSEGERR